jgi:ActR/RegA family two-component response regulator
VKTTKILVVDDGEREREDLKWAAEADDGRIIFEAEDTEKAIELIRKECFDVIVTDLEMGPTPQAGLSVLRAARDADPEAQVIVITAWGSKDISVESIEKGAIDYIERNSQGTDVLGLLKIKINRAVAYRELVRKEREKCRLISAYLNAWFPDYLGEDALLIVAVGARLMVNLGPLRSEALQALDATVGRPVDDLLTALDSIDVIVSSSGADVSPLRRRLSLPPGPEATVEFLLTPRRQGLHVLTVVLLHNNDEIHRADFAFAAHEQPLEVHAPLMEA